MDPTSVLEIVCFLVLVVLYALFAAADVALVGVRRARLRELAEEGQPIAARIERLASDPVRLSAIAHFGMSLVGFLAVASASIVFLPGAGHITHFALNWLSVGRDVLALILIVMVATLFMVIFGQLLPQRLAHHYAEPVALVLAVPFEWFAWLAWPVVRAMMVVAHGLADFLGGAGESDEASEVLEEEIRTIVEAGEEEGAIEEDEREMIYSIFEFGETLAREIMVPRIDVAAVEADTSMLDVLDVILRAGHSRIPVYSETIDNIIGLLYAKDLLTYLRDGKTDVPLSKVVRPAYFVPETKKVNALLQDLQQLKVHMVIVVDEYGGTAGLVTIEDILEEIVGEIQDEYDTTEEDSVEYSAPGEIVFNARVNLDDASQVLGVELPAEGGDTLGGLIYSQLGRVPAVQDEVLIDGIRFTVLSVVGRRIKKVKATRLGLESDEKPPEDGRHEADGAGEISSA